LCHGDMPGIVAVEVRDQNHYW